MEAKPHGPHEGNFIGAATDFQVLVEKTMGRPTGSPGRAFAAIRQKLPAELHTRVQRLVRARNGEAHPAREDETPMQDIQDSLHRVEQEAALYFDVGDGDSVNGPVLGDAGVCWRCCGS